MTCPFAKLSAMLPVPLAAQARAYHHAHAAKPLVDEAPAGSLAEALRLGTAATHRAVERSRGVALLLRSHATPNTDEQLLFDRTDYVRFNIMLAAIYTVLESSMVASRASPLLSPLFDDAGLVEALGRSAALLDDVRVHLDVIESHTGATLSDLATHAHDEHALTPGEGQDVENRQARTQLLELVSASTPGAFELCGSSRAGLTVEHVALLRPVQVAATLRYVHALLRAQDAEDGGLLLAHAYTRYLGDLSGGQHIQRRVVKRFPTPSRGFDFYTFESPDELKSRFRSAMNAKPAQIPAVVAEANTAFDLNTALFESLLPPDLRQPQSMAQVGAHKHSQRLNTTALIVVAAATASITAAWLAHSSSTPPILA